MGRKKERIAELEEAVQLLNADRATLKALIKLEGYEILEGRDGEVVAIARRRGTTVVERKWRPF